MNIADIPKAPPPQGPGGWFSVTKMSRSFALAARSLWLHKLRTVLSVLGIIIGTGAVIALMAFGEGSMKDALDDIKRQGATNIVVLSKKPPDEGATASRSFVATYGLTMRDLARMKTFGDVIERIVPMRVFSSEVRYLGLSVNNGRLVATTEQYAEVNKLTLSRGRFLSANDNDHMLNHCVLGAGLADKLFPFEDPLGKAVVVRNQDYRVVGVCADRMPTGGTGGSQSAEDFNNDVYIPFETCKVRVGSTVIQRTSGSRSGERVEVSQLTLTVRADFDTDAGREQVRAIGKAIKDMLRNDHLKEDWSVSVPLDRLEEAERAQARFTNLLAVVAGISLLVGGIGIMNIMLATVTERTREIGIRRALGAKQRDIIVQFLVEAVAQTSLGGLIGILAGVLAAFAVPPLAAYLFSEKLVAVLRWQPVALAVGVSVVVGLLAGLYPAWRAAKLDPIEALRHT